MTPRRGSEELAPKSNGGSVMLYYKMYFSTALEKMKFNSIFMKITSIKILDKEQSVFDF